MEPGERERFDALLEEAIDALPPGVRALLDEVPVIVDDEPSPAIVRALLADQGEEATPEGERELARELCGLHTGIALTEASVQDSGVLPTDVRLFRRGIIALAGGWDGDEADDAVYEEIMVTLLHEIGHHFGLTEEDLEALGYD